MKKGKVMYCLGVVGACFVVGIGSYGIGHARVIPGVDEPYDPANYYSMTSISYADSAPSPFALKDLAICQTHEGHYGHPEYGKLAIYGHGKIWHYGQEYESLG